MHRRLLFTAFAAICLTSARGQGLATDEVAGTTRGPLSVGVYAGELYHSEFFFIFSHPDNLDLVHSYLAALNLDYRFYEATRLPIQFEGEVDVAKRFDGADQFDFDVAPFVRWTSFPWNRWLYTNARFGALGLSYVTGISAWERQNSGNETGSRLLHFLVSELDFSSSANARAEAFVRVHHRSGIWGAFDGVYGGSSYLCLGFRVFW